MSHPAMSPHKCPSCGKQKIVTDDSTGEMFCAVCGFVLNDKLEDTGAEWRSFAGDETNRARTGAGTSLTMHDMGLSTVIGAANKDATGRPLSTGMKSSIERLRTWDSRTQAHTAAERNLRQALNEMGKMQDKLALANAVIEKAAYIYRKAMEKKLVRGRSIHGLVAACLYAACRNTETPRTLDDIANGINIRRKDVARCYRLIYRELDLKMPVRSKICPPEGGDTLWSSMTAAYNGLSKSMQGFLSNLEAEHDFSFGFKESLAELGGRERLAQAVADNPPVSHPVIRIHPESGKKVIFVNALFTTKILGLPANESSEILSFLYGHVITPEFTCRFHWRSNSIAIWDNRSTQHKPINDYFPEHRLLERVAIDGDKPY